jgi:hypothetical protein
VLPGDGQVVDDPLQLAEAAVVPDLRPVDVLHGHEVGALPVQRDPVHPRPGGHDLPLVGAHVPVGVAQHDDVADVAAGDVDRAVVGDRDDPRVLEPVRELLDP